MPGQSGGRLVCKRRAAQQGNPRALLTASCGGRLLRSWGHHREMPYNSHPIALPADVFSLALHPSRPLLAAGLSSGHLHAYTWPHSGDSGEDEDEGGDAEDEGGFRVSWKTRRHKGSCRCIAFSGDGGGALLTVPPLRPGADIQARSDILVRHRLALQGRRLRDRPSLCQNLRPRSPLVIPLPP